MEVKAFISYVLSRNGPCGTVSHVTKISRGCCFMHRILLFCTLKYTEASYNNKYNGSIHFFSSFPARKEPEKTGLFPKIKCTAATIAALSQLKIGEKNNTNVSTLPVIIIFLKVVPPVTKSYPRQNGPVILSIYCQFLCCLLDSSVLSWSM